MANILKVTTPLNGYENPVRPGAGNTPSDISTVRNPVDPGRVVRSDGKPEAENGGQNNLGLLYDSNFGNFIQSLRSAPNISDILPELLFSGMDGLKDAGISPETAGEITKFFNTLKMNDAQFLSFFKNQINRATQFSGPFFSLIRDALNHAPTVELRSAILNFAKKYSDMASGPHILDSMRLTLSRLTEYMFKDAASILSGMAQKLQNTKAGDTDSNAMLLKNEIIPFLGKYVAQTKARGTMRDLTGLLILQASRYENGSRDGVIHAYKYLQRFPSFSRYAGSFSAEDAADFIRNGESADRTVSEAGNQWENHFINILKSAVSGEAGSENKQVFENILQSFLLNESVYMPVLHLMLPAELNGHSLFSEIWIDPDDTSDASENEKGIRMLLKFSIKDVGAFDLIFYYSDAGAQLHVFYPEQLSASEENIRDGLNNILKNNHIRCLKLEIEKSGTPVSPEAVFPKIAERRDSINVSV